MRVGRMTGEGLLSAATSLPLFFAVVVVVAGQQGALQELILLLAVVVLPADLLRSPVVPALLRAVATGAMVFFSFVHVPGGAGRSAPAK